MQQKSLNLKLNSESDCKEVYIKIDELNDLMKDQSQTRSTYFNQITQKFQVRWGGIPCEQKDKILMIRDTNILDHLKSNILSIQADKTVSDVLLIFESGSFKYVFLNPQSAFYEKVKQLLKLDFLQSLSIIFQKDEAKNILQTDQRKLYALIEEYKSTYSIPSPQSSQIKIKDLLLQQNNKDLSENMGNPQINYDEFQRIINNESQSAFEDKNLQAFTMALIAILNLMKRKAIDFISKDIANQKDELVKKNDLNTSCELTCVSYGEDDLISENNNLQNELTNNQVFVCKTISIKSNRELQINHHKSEKYKNTAQKHSKTITDLTVRSLFQKLKRKNDKKREMELNQSFYSNNSTAEQSDMRSQMFSPPGLNINTSNQSQKDQFFQNSPQGFNNYQQNQQNAYFEQEEDNYQQPSYNNNQYYYQEQQYPNQTQMYEQFKMSQYVQNPNQQYQQQSFYNQQQKQQQNQMFWNQNQQSQNRQYQVQQNYMKYQQFYIAQNPQNIQQINNFYIIPNQQKTEQFNNRNMQQQQQSFYQGYSNQNQQEMPVWGLNYDQTSNQMIEMDGLFQPILIRECLPPRYQKLIYKKEVKKRIKKSKQLSQQRNNYNCRKSQRNYQLRKALFNYAKILEKDFNQMQY